jgi:hypothetical protein
MPPRQSLVRNSEATKATETITGKNSEATKATETISGKNSEATEVTETISGADDDEPEGPARHAAYMSPEQANGQAADSRSDPGSHQWLTSLWDLRGFRRTSFRSGM